MSIGSYVDWLFRWGPAWAVITDIPYLDAGPPDVRGCLGEGSALAVYVWATYAW